jgi:phytoene dehydrogenase-like protein
MTETIIIIGGGIAGLAAGCYGQMNGYQTKIFEMHDLPGGLCTSWERKDFIFDGCIHYLFGTGEGQPFNQLWQELGVLDGRVIINHAELMRVVDTDGRAFIAYCNPDRLEEHLKELSPGDAGVITDFANGIRAFSHFDMSLLQEKPRTLWLPADGLKMSRQMSPYMMPLIRWGRVSAGEYAKRFKDPFLRQAFPLVFGWPEIPAMVGFFILAYMHTGNAGFPAGGSLAFARALEKRYLELGGEIHYKAQVQKILSENNLASGVRLYDDSEHRASHVISAGDGRGTMFDLLGDSYVNKRIRDTYDGHLPIHSQVQVSLGVNRDMSNEPHWVTYLLEEPVMIGGEERTDFGIKHYSFDPSLAPPGKSVIEVMFRSNYDYWQRIYGRKLYDIEQNQIADQVIELLERYHPGIRGQIEIVDVATPLSYERYTGNWQGSTSGWLLTRQTMLMMILGMKKTVPGLKNFYQCGQWVEAGGSVPSAAMSGRNAIQLICHADRRVFTVGKT